MPRIYDLFLISLSQEGLSLPTHIHSFQRLIYVSRVAIVHIRTAFSDTALLG